jgi:ABC-type nitrate/sulfonate/bicarbonate transport system substrate-binding protein
MLRSGLLMLMLALASPLAVLSQNVGPDPVPANVPACDRPDATLKIGAFSRGNQQLIAEQKGWINGPNNKYTVGYCQVVSSQQQFWSLANANPAGTKYDLILTTVDNLINRKANGMGNYSTFAVFDNTPSQVILGTRNVRTPADLKGKNIITDSSTSGYVIQFRGVAANHGLYLEKKDYNLVAYGGTVQRYAALRAGNATINGQVMQLDATVVGPPQSYNYLLDSSAYGLNLVASIDEYHAPLSGIALAGTAEFFDNPIKVAAAVEYLKALMKGHAVLVQPENRPYVESVLVARVGYTQAVAAMAYDALLSPVSGTITTIKADFATQRLPFMNTCYLRERFGGFDNKFQSFDELYIPGPGRLIDNTLRDAAYTQFTSEIAMNVNVSTSVTAQCIYPALGQTYSVYSASAAISAGVSGGCSGAPSVSYVSCTASDDEFSADQCVYDASSDILRIVAKTPSLTVGRTYTVSWSVNDICGASQVVKQTVRVQALTQLNHSGCKLV